MIFILLLVKKLRVVNLPARNKSGGFVGGPESYTRVPLSPVSAVLSLFLMCMSLMVRCRSLARQTKKWQLPVNRRWRPSELWVI